MIISSFPALAAVGSTQILFALQGFLRPEIVGELGTPCGVMNRVRDEKKRRGGGAVSLHTHTHNAHTTPPPPPPPAPSTHSLSDKTDSSIRSALLLSLFSNCIIELYSYS